MKAKEVSGGAVGNLLATSAGALLVEFVLQVVAGWYLNRAYIPSPDHAHSTMQAIMAGSPHATIASFHYWGSAFFTCHSLLHLCLMLFTGWYRPPHHWRWIGAVAVFACAMLFQLTGNLLPFDQHGVQTAAIEGGIAASIPGGQPIAKLMMGGEPTMNANTLTTWYMAHRLLIPLALILGTLGAIATHIKRGDVKTYWIPATILALVPLAIAMAVKMPLGTAATADDYNRFSALVSWYSWPLHGSLMAFSLLGPSLGWIGSAVIPTLFGVFLISAPLLSKRLANAGVQFIFAGFMVYFLAVGVLFGGRFAPLTGTRDPVSADVDPGNGSQVQTPIDSALANQGRQTFNSLPCAGCHGQDGLKAAGGPKLDQIYKQHSDAEWYIQFIANPKSKKPDSTMPGFPDLKTDELKALAEFLRQPH